MNFKAVNIENKNEKEIINNLLKTVSDITKDNTYKSINYNADNVVKFKSRKLTLDKDIVSTLNKISDFYNSLEITRVHYLKNAKIENDFNYIDEKGIHCIFISVLTKLILKKLYNINANLVQGYYKFKNNPLASLVFGEYSLGFHSWLEIKGAVIDLTFNSQQSSSYNGFIEGNSIIGVYNDDIDLVGYIENEDVVDKYIDDFLKINNISLEEWVNLYIDYLNLNK